jgi:YVTN family beta-propeller protein
MALLAVQGMARRLTVPFSRGADTQTLAMGAANASVATVVPYDFLEHLAAFGRPPVPRYVLTARRDVVAATTLSITHRVSPAPALTATVHVPEGSLAGSSFVIDLGLNEGPDVRLETITSDPPVPPSVTGPLSVADVWEVTALLGEAARMLWVLGVERDQIRRHLEIVLTQRRLAAATAASLDALGSDRGVPRFPPRPYSFDPATTIALYHLDDRPLPSQVAVAAAEDVGTRYTGAGHPATNTLLRAVHGADGRFGQAFGIRQPDAVLAAPDHPDLALPAAASFTVECFLRPEAVVPAVPTLEARVLTKHADPANPALPGWALSVGHFNRGIPANVRFLVSDGTSQRLLFADVELVGDRFHHLAGVVDRAAREVRLFVDGDLRRVASLDVPGPPIGALTSPAALEIGRPGTATMRYLVDEVRLSRIARPHFSPVLGEDDEAYRRRLRVFQRWTLPTAAALQAVLNEAAGPIGGVADALVVDDQPSTLVSGSHPITVLPTTLAAGERISALGDKRADEATVNGTAADEVAFDPAYLVATTIPSIVYAPPPPRVLKPRELPPDPHRMQLGAERSLLRLVGIVNAIAPTAHLRVESAFDPRADDLRAVGRGLLLSHTSIDLGQLGALAHRAGFSFVTRRDVVPAVYASVGIGEYVEIVRTAGGTAVSGDGFDGRRGETFVLGIRPALPPDSVVRWSTIACGQGRGRFTTSTETLTTTLEATATGDLEVKVDVTRDRRTTSGTRRLRIVLVDLPNNESIAADGAVGVADTVAGGPEPFFDPAYLVAHDDPRASYGVTPDGRRMQRSVAARLDRLLDLIAGTGVPSQLEILEAYVPGAADIRARGRGLVVRHPDPAMGPGSLGVLAHVAGFSWVRRTAGTIRIRQAADELVSVTGPDTVEESALASLVIGPRARPQGLAVRPTRAYTANRGSETVSEIDTATGRVLRATKVDRDPVAVVLRPDGLRLFVANHSSDTITVLDTGTMAIVARIGVAAEPLALAHHPTQPFLYVACRAANAIQEIDTTTNTASAPVVVGPEPVSVAARANGAELWVALAGTTDLRVVSTAGLATIGVVPLAGPASDVALASDEIRAYATLPDDDQLAIVDVATRTVTSTVLIGPGNTAPIAVAVAANSATVAVVDAAIGAERIRVFEANGVARTPHRIGLAPGDVAFDGSLVFTVEGGSDTVTVFDVGVTPLEPIVLTATWRLGSGLGERLTWVTRAAGRARARLTSTTLPQVQVLGESAGRALVRAVYNMGDRNDPYTFDVRLVPAVAANPAVTISKEQYDLIMNVLNAFHPIGIEVRTEAVRQRVVEVRDDPANSLPDYTYPNFRVRGPSLKRPASAQS